MTVPQVYWSSSEDLRLLQLAIQQPRLTWTEIGLKISRSKDACSGRYKALSRIPRGPQEIPVSISADGVLVPDDSAHVARLNRLGGFSRFLWFEGKMVLVTAAGQLFRKAAA